MRSLESRARGEREVLRTVMEVVMDGLDGRVAIVTGGLSGIGRASAAALAAAGANVMVFDARTTSRDDAVEGEAFASALGTDAAYLQGDVTDEADVDRLFDHVAERYGRLDVVVNSAGVTVFKPLLELTPDDLDRVMAVNVRGTFLVCRRAVRDVSRAGRGGSIINVASNFGLVGGAETSIYSASKGAVISFTKAVAAEVGQAGIRVNALCPGATATEFNRGYRETRPDIVELWRRKTPLRMPGRDDFLATAGDIANAVVFLAGNGSLYMTGAALVIDGGWNAE